VCRQAFRRLDKDGSGVVTLSDLVGVYKTNFHPAVIAGRMTHEEAVREFMSQWDTKDKDGIITLAELEEYYRVRLLCRLCIVRRCEGARGDCCRRCAVACAGRQRQHRRRRLL
jgi:hypothetical protein